MTGFRNYLQHEVGFLEYLKGRDSCDDTSLGCYQRFSRHLDEEDLGGAPDEGLASPLGQLLRDLQAVRRDDSSQRVGTRDMEEPVVKTSLETEKRN